ncbi:MAG: methylenetetrahydrofolate reductase C-terminal domain-containing protein [Armatimonadetes bacterium]|nr:methylenetetrahydrofolate reductase C-terminal domain-containing protein [Armatimonadota bacterium]
MSRATYPNHVRDSLATDKFVLTIELTTPQAIVPLDDAMRPLLVLAREIRDDPRIDAIALTDRSRSDHDHDPIVIGHRIAEACGKMPIIHWAGKDRSLRDLDADLERAEALGLDTLLLVTGDKVRHQPAGRPVRYLDSINALCAARQRSAAFFLAAAVSPFKYREEELINQYLKAAKKLRAGADFLMTQIGWDLLKFEELRWFLGQRAYHPPLVAELLFLTAARSRRIRRYGLPGVTVTDDVARRLEEEASSGDGGRDAAYRRLALQIATVRDLGYVGAQVSGLFKYASIVRLLDEVDAVTRIYPTQEARAQAWRELWIFQDGRPAKVAPADGLYLHAPVVAERSGVPAETTGRFDERVRFKVMDLIDRLFFRDGSLGARVLGPRLRRLDARLGLGGVLLRAERVIKEPLVGCQACGFCRLPHTAYVCPETCPKGLANGPCGGTKDNWCEFGDRECIHNQIYRISKQAGLLSNLEEVLIPPVPEAAWNSCSWVTHFRGEGPEVKQLPVPESRSMRIKR